MEYENDDTPDPHFAGFNGAPAIETTPAAAYREGWNAYWLRWGDAVNPYEPMTALSHAWEAGASDRKRCILTMKCPDPTELGFPDTV